MSERAKSILKFLAGAGGLVAVGTGLLLLIDYLRYRQSPDYRILKNMEELERRYAEDPYGGATPEETLALFIDALKRGDVELASKYFPLDQQTKQAQQLEQARSRDALDDIIREADQLRLTKREEQRAFFTIANAKQIVEVEVVLGKNVNNRWKIIEL